MIAEVCDDGRPKYIVNTTRTILRILGAWPLPAASPLSARIKCRILNCIVYFLLLFTIVPGVLKMFLQATSTEAQIRIAGPVINCTSQFIKFTVVLYRAKEIKKSLALISHDWMGTSEDDRHMLRDRAIMERKVAVIFLSVMYGGGMGYRVVVPLLKGPIVTADNVTIRPLSCPVYYIVLDEQTSPVYEITYVLQCMAGFAIYAIMTGSCGTCAFLALHVCHQLRILKSKITTLGKYQSADVNVIQHGLKDIIDHRTKIKGVTLVSLSSTRYAPLSCLTRIVPILLHSTAASAVALNPTRFRNQNSSVGLTANTMNWDHFPMHKARCLILIIVISNYPMKLTAGKMFDMSLTTFTDIMKMSMGYLNLLREVL
ncbi:uncharacterized protein LOC143373190 [Andrena cerasifolii]|uniref:uncharacterized protein LOC143373190 n=1 Tax=Andrena cerasifolii TaxID=2819439 RepID=UPI0040383DFF